MTIEELKSELEPIRRGGIKISDTNIKNAINRAIKKIALKTTPLNLITKDKTEDIIKEIEIDEYLIKEGGYYIREPKDTEVIDLDAKLLSGLLYLVAYEFAPSKEQTRLLTQASEEINSYKWYLYELASVEGFDIDDMLPPYSVIPYIDGKKYTFEDSFLQAFDDYCLGKDIPSIRDKEYIDRFFDYLDNDLNDEVMIALDVVLVEV